VRSSSAPTNSSMLFFASSTIGCIISLGTGIVRHARSASFARPSGKQRKVSSRPIYLPRAFSREGRSNGNSSAEYISAEAGVRKILDDLFTSALAFSSASERSKEAEALSSLPQGPCRASCQAMFFCHIVKDVAASWNTTPVFMRSRQVPAPFRGRPRGQRLFCTSRDEGARLREMMSRYSASKCPISTCSAGPIPLLSCASSRQRGLHDLLALQQDRLRSALDTGSLLPAPQPGSPERIRRGLFPSSPSAM